MRKEEEDKRVKMTYGLCSKGRMLDANKGPISDKERKNIGYISVDNISISKRSFG